MKYEVRKIKDCHGAKLDYMWRAYDDINSAFQELERQTAKKSICSVKKCQMEMIVVEMKY